MMPRPGKGHPAHAPLGCALLALFLLAWTPERANAARKAFLGDLEPSGSSSTPASRHHPGSREPHREVQDTAEYDVFDILGDFTAVVETYDGAGGYGYGYGHGYYGYYGRYGRGTYDGDSWSEYDLDLEPFLVAAFTEVNEEPGLMPQRRGAMEMGGPMDGMEHMHGGPHGPHPLPEDSPDAVLEPLLLDYDFEQALVLSPQGVYGYYGGYAHGAYYGYGGYYGYGSDDIDHEENNWFDALWEASKELHRAVDGAALEDLYDNVQDGNALHVARLP